MSDLIRRDPLAERIARNRLHPLHASLQTAQPRWVGPSGLVRKNPHAIGFIGPNGLKRIDRSGAQQQGTGTRNRGATVADVELPLWQVEHPLFHVVVVPDMPGGRLSSHDRDVLGLARQLVGGEGVVTVVAFAGHKETEFARAGVDRLLQLEGDEYLGYKPEQRLQALEALERELAPRHWLFPDSRTGGGEMGRRLAARLGERPATRVWQVADEYCVGRAGNGQQDLQRSVPRIVLAAAECAEPVSETRHEALPLLLEATVARCLRRIEDQGQVAVDPSAIPMAEAEFILSAGNGVTDWALFHRAAEILGATEGASRVAVDAGNMPRSRQVGATGTWVTARVYVAVGISGAIQHLQGIGACDKVVAINMDPSCDMIKRADLSLIGDSTQILQALIECVERFRQGDLQDVA